MSAEVGLDKSGVTGDIPAYVPDDDGDTAFDVGKGPVRANFSAIGKEIGSGGTGGGASSACFVLSLSFSLSREALLVIIRNRRFFLEGVSGTP